MSKSKFYKNYKMYPLYEHEIWFKQTRVTIGIFSIQISDGVYQGMYQLPTIIFRAKSNASPGLRGDPRKVYHTPQLNRSYCHNLNMKIFKKKQLILE